MIRKLVATAAALVATLGLSTASAHAATRPAPADQVAAVSFTVQPVPAPVAAPAATLPALPAAGPATYTVAPADTLWAISARFCGRGDAYPALAAASGIRNPAAIQPGWTIRLDCTRTAPAPARTTAASRSTARTTAAPTTATTATGRLADVMAYALAQVGKPYVYGAAGPNAFDCSGLVVAAYRSIGISLPHFTGDLLGHGVSVSRANLRAGDLVFLSAGHVGLVVDSGHMVAAPHSGARVQVQTIYAFYAGRRIAT